MLDETQTRLQALLTSAQKLSLERYTLADQLAGLVEGLERPADSGAAGTSEGTGMSSTGTLLQQMAVMQDELARLEAGLVWVSVLEKVLGLRYVLSVTSAAVRPMPASS